jgi:hypothetical protein
MIRADRAAAGVMFSIDTETGSKLDHGIRYRRVAGGRRIRPEGRWA